MSVDATRMVVVCGLCRVTYS